MARQFLSVSLAALLLAGGGLAAAWAQQGQGGPMGQGAPGMMMQQDRPVDRPDGEAAGDRGGPTDMQGMEQMQRMMQEMMSRMGDDRGMMGRHHGMRGDGYRSGRYGMRGDGYRGGRHGMRGDRGGMHRAHMMRTLIILMDTDGDGELSLEEVQAVTERFFNAMDADGNGSLSPEEIRGFYSMRGAMPGLADDGEDDNGEDGNGEDGSGQAQ